MNFPIICPLDHCPVVTFPAGMRQHFRRAHRGCVRTKAVMIQTCGITWRFRELPNYLRAKAVSTLLFPGKDTWLGHFPHEADFIVLIVPRMSEDGLSTLWIPCILSVEENRIYTPENYPRALNILLFRNENVVTSDDVDLERTRLRLLLLSPLEMKEFYGHYDYGAVRLLPQVFWITHDGYISIDSTLLKP